MKVEYWLPRRTRKGKEWVAEIFGEDEQFGYQREFLRPAKREWSSTGRTGRTMYLLEEGCVYEANHPYEGRKFLVVRGGMPREIPEWEALEQIRANNQGENNDSKNHS